MQIAELPEESVTRFATPTLVRSFPKLL